MERPDTQAEGDDRPSDIPPGSIEILKGQLYYVPRDPPPERPVTSMRFVKSIVFTADSSFVYTSYFADFGPFDLGITYQFCQNLQAALQEAREHRRFVVFYAGSHEQKRVNSVACLMAYLIFVLDFSVERAYRPFLGINPPFITFRDAGFCINTYPITIIDIARAFRKAKTLGHFDFRTFNLTAYQNMGKLQNGDMSWIIPGKFIAFSGPLSKKRQLSPGVFTLLPEQYVPLFKDLNVTCVVRFNEKMYDRRVFLNHNIRHVDLFYEDGGNPTDTILNAFLQLCEQERGAIAVHCKAGLGRTGTNIAAYMMKHYGYSAKEAIAWCRVCRPGCVVGPQQQYLSVMEAKLWKDGEEYQSRQRVQMNTNNSEKRRSSSGRLSTNANGTFANISNSSTNNNSNKGSTAGTDLTSDNGDSDYNNGNAQNSSKASHFKTIHTGLQQIMQQQQNQPENPSNSKRKSSASSATAAMRKKSFDGSAAAAFPRPIEGQEARETNSTGNTTDKHPLAASLPHKLPQQELVGDTVDNGHPRAFDYPDRPRTSDGITSNGGRNITASSGSSSTPGNRAVFTIPPPHSATVSMPTRNGTTNSMKLEEGVAALDISSKANPNGPIYTNTSATNHNGLDSGNTNANAPLRRVQTAYSSTSKTNGGSSRVMVPTYTSEIRTNNKTTNPNVASFGVENSNNYRNEDASSSREAWSESGTPRLSIPPTTKATASTSSQRPISSTTPRSIGSNTSASAGTSTKMPAIASAVSPTSTSSKLASAFSTSPYAMPVAPNSALKKRISAK